LVKQITSFLGGEMIKEVSFEKTTYAELPHKFEAGTPNIADGIVLGTAIDYMNQIGFDNIQKTRNSIIRIWHQAFV
jgi:cysteine desulfurase/selenocysteine lyase